MMVVSLEQKQAEQVVQTVGSATNIKRVIHCVTRLRFYLVDPCKVDSPQLVAIDGVAGEAFNALLGQYQVVIGPGVHEVYEMVENVLQDATRESDAQPSTMGAWQRHQAVAARHKKNH
ncbi:PTS transporter subunit EIIB [Weissella cibaria]|uniref:PTS transporter subunit EIIB n=1 Tax=Weissella cibaria TaxID=137591 RepID=UPI001FD6A83F|nr:PTS transporter subunit EIIB [Weissella cibaria]